MKYSKRYVVFGVLLAAALFVKFNTLGASYEEIRNFRGATLEAETWNPLIASSVNDNLLSVVIDNKEYTNEDYSFYMDDKLNLMVPITILRDALNCSAHLYGERQLLVEKHSSEVAFRLYENMATVNGEEKAIVSPLTRQDNNFYVSLNDLSNYLGYSYSWNMQENQASAVDTSGNASIIPTRYDLREKYRAAQVRNQGEIGRAHV